MNNRRGNFSRVVKTFLSLLFLVWKIKFWIKGLKTLSSLFLVWKIKFWIKGLKTLSSLFLVWKIKFGSKVWRLCRLFFSWSGKSNFGSSCPDLHFPFQLKKIGLSLRVVVSLLKISKFFLYPFSSQMRLSLSLLKSHYICQDCAIKLWLICTSVSWNMLTLGITITSTAA